MTAQQTASTAQPISLWRRLAVIIYDGFLLAAVLFFAAAVPTIAFGITQESPAYPLLIVYIYGIAFLYYGWFWTQGGQTLAMKTWNVKIESTQGESISWGQALIRFLVAMLGWLPVALGYLWSLIRKDKATWHDLASKTRLLKLPKAT